MLGGYSGELRGLECCEEELSGYLYGVEVLVCNELTSKKMGVPNFSVPKFKDFFRIS